MTARTSAFRPYMRVLLPALVLGIPAPLAAQDFQSTRGLDTLVGQFTGKTIGAEGGARTPIDPRLKLAACPAPQLAWRDETQDTVVIRCMAPSWRIFVPLNAAPRVVARPPVAPAPVRAPAAARAEPVIRRGDTVTLVAGAAGFAISRQGTALNDAAPGGRLQVKVDETKAPVQAVAVEAGRATLPGWGG